MIRNVEGEGKTPHTAERDAKAPPIGWLFGQFDARSAGWRIGRLRCRFRTVSKSLSRHDDLPDISGRVAVPRAVHNDPGKIRPRREGAQT